MVSVWFTRRHNHGEDCWSDSCPEDNHWHPSQGGEDTNIHYQRSCSQSAELSGRKKCGRKRCSTNRENRSLMRIVKQNQFKNLCELHKEWTEAGVKTSRAPHTDVSRNLATVVFRDVLPGLRRRRTGLLPSGPKSSFQMHLLQPNSFLSDSSSASFDHHIQEMFPQSVMIWVQCHLLVLVHCVFWKPTSLHPFTKKCWSTSCFLLLTSFLKMLISFSSRIWHLPTLPKAPEAG